MAPSSPTQISQGQESHMELSNALPILRALADGVNPVTGDVFPETSPYAEPRTLRAIYSAVDLVQREVEREKRREKLPANFGKPWTEGEDTPLRDPFQKGIPLPQTPPIHARPPSRS